MTFDSLVLLLECRDICDVCKHFERCCHFESALEYSLETNTNRVDLHVSLKPYIIVLLLFQLILWSVACDHDRLDITRGS